MTIVSEIKNVSRFYAYHTCMHTAKIASMLHKGGLSAVILIIDIHLY